MLLLVTAIMRRSAKEEGGFKMISQILAKRSSALTATVLASLVVAGPVTRSCGDRRRRREGSR
jgi:hypothetical protein